MNISLDAKTLRDPATRDMLRAEANEIIKALNTFASGAHDARNNEPYSPPREAELCAVYNEGWDSVRLTR